MHNHIDYAIRPLLFIYIRKTQSTSNIATSLLGMEVGQWFHIIKILWWNKVQTSWKGSKFFFFRKIVLRLKYDKIQILRKWNCLSHSLRFRQVIISNFFFFFKPHKRPISTLIGTPLWLLSTFDPTSLFTVPFTLRVKGKKQFLRPTG